MKNGESWLLIICVDHQSAPYPLPGSTEAIAFSCESKSWLLILSEAIIDPPWISRGDHLFTWVKSWLLIPSEAIINPPPDQQRWLPFHMKVTSWLLFPYEAIVNPPNQQRWSPFHAKVKVDCWSSLRWSSIPHPRINRGNCLFTRKLKLTVDTLWGDRWFPPDQQRHCLFTWKWKLTVDGLQYVAFFVRESPCRFRSTYLVP